MRFKIPFLPLSVLIFYLSVVFLWFMGFIPSPLEIISFLEGLYFKYGLAGLTIATFLEGIVYLGLYFPGSFVIALAVFLSDGTFYSLAIISFIVSATWTVTCAIDYLLGRYVRIKNKDFKEERKKFTKGFLFSFLHQNFLAFYFFNEGIKKKNPWKLLVVFPIMFLWGLVVVYIFYIFRDSLRVAIESPFLMITFISIWFLVAFIYENRRFFR